MRNARLTAPQAKEESPSYPKYPLITAACRVLRARGIEFSVENHVKGKGELEPVLHVGEEHLTEHILQGEIPTGPGKTLRDTSYPEISGAVRQLLPENLEALKDTGIVPFQQGEPVENLENLFATHALQQLYVLPVEGGESLDIKSPELALGQPGEDKNLNTIELCGGEFDLQL